MMMEAIYSGNFRPSETCVDDIPGSWDLGKEIGELRDELKRRLDTEDYLLVDQLTEKIFYIRCLTFSVYCAVARLS